MMMVMGVEIAMMMVTTGEGRGRREGDDRGENKRGGNSIDHVSLHQKARQRVWRA
jgi:hypothetical protein